MSINNPRDPEMQNAYKALAVIAVVIGVLTITAVLVQSRSLMSEAAAFDREMADWYEPLYRRAVGIAP